MGEQERCTKGGAGLGGGLGMEELIGPEDTEWLWIASREGKIDERKSNVTGDRSVICTKLVIGADIPPGPCLGSAGKTDNN